MALHLGTEGFSLSNWNAILGALPTVKEDKMADVYMLYNTH